MELNSNIKVSCWVSIDNGRNGDICYSCLLAPVAWWYFSITNNMANGHGLSPFDIPGPRKVSCAIVYNNEVFGIIIMIISCVLPPSYASISHEHNLCFALNLLILKITSYHFEYRYRLPINKHNFMYISYPFANLALLALVIWEELPQWANRKKGMQKSSQRENENKQHWGLLQAETEKDMNVIIRI